MIRWLPLPSQVSSKEEINVLRVSPHIYNSKDDIDDLLGALGCFLHGQAACAPSRKRGR